MSLVSQKSNRSDTVVWPRPNTYGRTSLFHETLRTPRASQAAQRVPDSLAYSLR